MKKLLFALGTATVLALATPAAHAQSGSLATSQPDTPHDTDLKVRKLPVVSVRSLDGKPVSTANLPGVGQGKPGHHQLLGHVVQALHCGVEQHSRTVP